MFQLYSKACQYVIRTLGSLVNQKQGEIFTAQKLCAEAKIPESYTRKILQFLVREKFLKAVRGPGGGYQLVRSPAGISVLDVIYTVEGKEHFDNCILGMHRCDSKKPCSLHNAWLKGKEKVIGSLQKLKVSEL